MRACSVRINAFCLIDCQPAARFELFLSADPRSLQGRALRSTEVGIDPDRTVHARSQRSLIAALCSVSEPFASRSAALANACRQLDCRTLLPLMQQFIVNELDEERGYITATVSLHRLCSLALLPVRLVDRFCASLLACDLPSLPACMDACLLMRSLLCVLHRSI